MTSSSGEWLALFLAAGKWWGRWSELHLNGPGTSQAGQTGSIVLGKKHSLVLEHSLGAQLQMWFCWGLKLCGLQPLLENNSALPLSPVQHGNILEIILWADTASPPIWSSFQAGHWKGTASPARFLLPSFPSYTGLCLTWQSCTDKTHRVVLYTWSLCTESQPRSRTWVLVLFPPASTFLSALLQLRIIFPREFFS